MQIWQHNIRYTNIFAMKDVVSEKKAGETKDFLEGIEDTTALRKWLEHWVLLILLENIFRQ